MSVTPPSWPLLLETQVSPQWSPTFMVCYQCQIQTPAECVKFKQPLTDLMKIEYGRSNFDTENTSYTFERVYIFNASYVSWK